MIPGRWFDGHSSRPHAVGVELRRGPRGPHLIVHRTGTDSEALEFTTAQVGWPQSWSEGRAPRTVVVDLGNSGSLEVDDVPRWLAARAAAGDKPSLAQRMQTRLPAFLAVLLVAACALWAFYRWGTPWAATQITRQVPLDWEISLAERALRDLDAGFLQPSQLPAERQAALQARFSELTGRVHPSFAPYPGYAPRMQLLLRSGAGANAFALPGGTLLMTDGLVAVAAKQGLGDEALTGVLAHEMGHVLHRHTTRMLVEQAVLNVGFGLAMGDVSSLLSVGSSLVTGLAYRRGHESEADCFAARLMQRAGLPTTPMADLLLELEGARQRKPAGAKDDSASALAGLLHSHPDSAQRAQRLKQGPLAGCSG